MPLINKENIKEYLLFLEKNKLIKLKSGQLSVWEKFNDDEIKEYLQKLYTKRQLDNSIRIDLEKNFITSRATVNNKEKEESKIPGKKPEVDLNKKVNVQTEPKTDPNKTVSTDILKKEKINRSKQYKNNFFLLLISIIFISSCVCIYFEFDDYKKLVRVYALTENINIRSKANTDSEILGKMHLFIRRDIELPSYESVVLIGRAKTDIKYYVVTPSITFIQYLFNNYEKLYVHADFVTTQRDVHKKYQDVFYNIRWNYYDRENLPLNARQLIVSAIESNAHLSGLVVATCCLDIQNYQEPSLAIMRNIDPGRDRSSVVLRLSNNKYYAVISDGDMSSDNIEVKDVRIGIEDLEVEGRFTYKNGTYYWKNCDGEITKSSSTYPYTYFY